MTGDEDDDLARGVFAERRRFAAFEPTTNLVHGAVAEVPQIVRIAEALGGGATAAGADPPASDEEQTEDDKEQRDIKAEVEDQAEDAAAVPERVGEHLVRGKQNE